MKRIAFCTLSALFLMALPLRAADPPPVFPAEGSTVPGPARAIKVVVKFGAEGNTCAPLAAAGPGGNPPAERPPKGSCEVNPGAVQWFACETDNCAGARFTFQYVPIRPAPPGGGWPDQCANLIKDCAQLLRNFGNARIPEVTMPTWPAPPANPGQCKLPMVRVTVPPVPPAVRPTNKPQHQVCGCVPPKDRVIYPPVKR